MKKNILLLTANLHKQRRSNRDKSHFITTSMDTEECTAVNTPIAIIMNAGKALVWAAFVLVLFTLGTPLAAAQTLRWDGTAPFCSGECRANETEIGRLGSIPDFWVPPFVNQNPSFGANCLTGSKALCLSTPGHTCRWNGTAPFCNGSCSPGETQTNPPPGSYSGSTCWTGSKVYCCSSAVSRIGQPLIGARDCSFGPDTCIKGFVWREAVSNDHICVTPQVRKQTRYDNTQAAARRSPTGGSDTCISGFVWREAFPGDHVCVTPQTRAQTAQDNKWSRIRAACP